MWRVSRRSPKGEGGPEHLASYGLASQPKRRMRSEHGCRAEARMREGGLQLGSRSYGLASQPKRRMRSEHGCLAEARMREGGRRFGQRSYGSASHFFENAAALPSSRHGSAMIGRNVPPPFAARYARR
jgi:hypothetical protein